MPRKCVALGCTSNYASENSYVQSFSFPLENDERRKAWICFTSRENWTPSKSSVICIKHFTKACLETRNSGSLKLTKWAIPTIQCEQVPAYLSSTKNARKPPEVKKAEIVAAIKAEEAERRTRDLIGNDFNTFKDEVPDKLNCFTWHIEMSSTYVAFYKCDFMMRPKIRKCIKIDDNFKLETFVDGVQLHKASYKEIKQWSILENLPKQYDNNSPESDPSQSIVQETVVHKCKRLIQEIFDELLEYYELNKDEDDIEMKSIKFLAEQFKLLNSPKNQRTYSSDMLVWSFMIFLDSRSTYISIRGTGYLVLPTCRHLQRLSSNLFCSPASEQENKHYLRNRIKHLSERERIVILQLDEIHIKEKYEYKGGKIVGCAENAAAGSVLNKKSNATVLPPVVIPAKTIQAFFVSSAFGKFKDVVSLHPMKNTTGDDLYEVTKKVLNLVQECGFEVIVVISDNNAINRSLFVLLNPTYINTLSFHWDDSKIETFLTFDSVHVAKCIKNRWMNFKGSLKTYFIPDFEDPENGRSLEACFEELRRLYTKTKGALLKDAHKLTYKTLWPSNLEQQKVSLTCNVFNDQTLAALRTEFKKGDGIITEGTVAFIDVITKWWTIMNCKDRFHATKTWSLYKYARTFFLQIMMQPVSSKRKRTYLRTKL